MVLKVQRVTPRPDPSRAVQWDGTSEGMVEIGRFLKTFAPDLHMSVNFHREMEMGGGAVKDHSFRLHIGLDHLREPKNFSLAPGDYLIWDVINNRLELCTRSQFSELYEVFDG